MSDQSSKCQTLAALHGRDDAWLIPNPWDAGSARDMQAAGFPAVATSSAALAYTLGLEDGEVSLQQKLRHCELLVAAVDVPVSVDFEDGFADTPEQVAEHVLRLAETGVAGCSIEDFSRREKRVFGFEESVERVTAAVQAAARVHADFQIIARAENLLRGHADLADTIARLQAYQQAGAHMLYAPGLSSLEDLAEVSGQLERPLNVLWPFFPGVSLQALQACGARRLSLGSALQVRHRSWLQDTLGKLSANGWTA